MARRKWTEACSMKTAYALKDENRKSDSKGKEAHYFQAAPEGLDLVQSRIVLPSKHMLPSAFSSSESFHRVCRGHEVYVTQPEDHVIQVSGVSVRRVQEATKAIHWIIHDMRISNDQIDGSSYIVQAKSCQTTSNIRLEVGKRPGIAGSNYRPDYNIAIQELQAGLILQIKQSAERWYGIDGDVMMRVRYGRIVLSQKPKTIPNEVAHAEYVSLMRKLSSREAAKLQYLIQDPSLAEGIVDALYQQNRGTTKSHSSSCDLFVETENGCFVRAASHFQEGILSLAEPELLGFPRTLFSRVVTAPDMKFDWSLDVQQISKTEVPSDLLKLAQHVGLGNSGSESGRWFRTPSVQIDSAMADIDLIKAIKVVESISIPIRDSLYFARVSVVQTLYPSSSERSQDWTLELYGDHWDTVLNHIEGPNQRRDWGVDLDRVWPGIGKTFETRTHHFLDNVLSLQSMLGRLRDESISS